VSCFAFSRHLGFFATPSPKDYCWRHNTPSFFSPAQPLTCVLFPYTKNTTPFFPPIDFTVSLLFRPFFRLRPPFQHATPHLVTFPVLAPFLCLRRGNSIFSFFPWHRCAPSSPFLPTQVASYTFPESSPSFKFIFSSFVVFSCSALTTYLSAPGDPTFHRLRVSIGAFHRPARFIPPISSFSAISAPVT